MSMSTTAPSAMTADYGFREAESPQGKRFIVTPPPYGGAATGLLIGGWLGVGLTGGLVGGFVLWGMLDNAFSGRGPSFLFCMLIAGLVCGGLFHALIRAKLSQARRTVTLTVTPAGLDVDGKLYARADIRALWVSAPPQNQSTHIVVSNSWNAGAQRSGQMAGEAVARKFAERGFGVALRYGGQEVKVVDQVHEGVATELVQRLTAALELAG